MRAESWKRGKGVKGEALEKDEKEEREQRAEPGKSKVDRKRKADVRKKGNADNRDI